MVCPAFVWSEVGGMTSTEDARNAWNAGRVVLVTYRVLIQQSDK